MSTPLEENIKEHLKTSGEVSFPMGSCDFMDMVTRNNTFVDKTLFIKDIIETEDKAMVITRPRRWGKSLNMSMLHYFFKKEVD